MANLSDQEVQKSIHDFVSEARQCAQRGNGFAAMSTIFNVVLAVSEAVNGRQRNKVLFSAFVPELTDKASWMVTPVAAPTDDVIVNILNNIRNGMAHALSLPENIALVNTIAAARQMANAEPNNYFVSTTDFVDVVEATVAKLRQTYPTAQFDPSGSNRGPAAGRTIKI